MNKKRSLSFSLLLLLLLSVAPLQAQLLSVTGEYRVVSVDRPGQRVGIALRDADPNKRQNWVYVKPGTRIVKRNFYSGNGFRDEIMTFNGFFDYVKKGTLLRVEGGRDWDKSIHAKKIWM
jgi:hypothetical protein